MSDLDMDYEERQTGMLVGRQAALADWRFRKENEGFEGLIKSLRATKWNREHPERRREIANRYAAKPEVMERANARAHRRRMARNRRAAEVRTCLECGVSWCPVPWARGLAGRSPFCTDACRQRYRYQQRTPGARRIRRRA